MVACRPAFVIRANTESILRSARDQDSFRMSAPSAVVKHLEGPIPHAHKKSRMSGFFAGTCAMTQRWRALKRGLLLQITNTLPRRRTILQSRCRALADFKELSTFTASS